MPRRIAERGRQGVLQYPPPHNPTHKPRRPTPAVSGTLIWPLPTALLTTQLEMETSLDLVLLSQVSSSQLFHKTRAGRSPLKILYTGAFLRRNGLSLLTRPPLPMPLSVWSCGCCRVQKGAWEKSQTPAFQRQGHKQDGGWTDRETELDRGTDIGAQPFR